MDPQEKLAAANRIAGALQEFVEPDERSQVHVFESSAGNLRAVIGTRKFAGVGPVQRQDAIWAYLNSRLQIQDRTYLFGVHALDNGEYAAYELRRRSDAVGSIDLVVRGGG